MDPYLPLKMDEKSPAVKKKRISKKRKSAWRKTDIQDVENFLEDQRLEERLGQPLKTLKDEEFFHIDVTPTETNKLLTKREKRRLKAQAPAKCYSMLQPHTKVPDPIKKRNRVRTREERRCPIVKKRELERLSKGILKKKELQSISDRQRDEKRRTEEDKSELKDIWDENDGRDNEWIEKLTERHTLRGVGKLTKVVPRPKNTLKGVLPDVEIPHPGMSYNPSFEDHQDLLRKVAEKELKLIKEEKHLNRVTKDIFRKVSVEENEKNFLKEMSEGLPNMNDQNQKDLKENNDENLKDNEKAKTDEKLKKDEKPYDSVNPPIINKKKTLKQRRKLKEQIELKENLKKAKIEKKKIADIYKLKFIESKIQKDEKVKELKRKKRIDKKQVLKKQTKRLGKLKFEEPDLEFNLGEEIAGNLRNIKTEGNLLKDRFQSLQKRNVLDTTKRHLRKKAKTKKFVKASFKDWEKTVVK